MDKLKKLIKEDYKMLFRGNKDIQVGALYLIMEYDYESHGIYKIKSAKDVKEIIADHSSGCIVGIFKCVKDDKAILGSMKETVTGMMSNKPKSEYEDLP